jgi:hypothetical protein
MLPASAPSFAGAGAPSEQTAPHVIAGSANEDAQTLMEIINDG